MTATTTYGGQGGPQQRERAQRHRVADQADPHEQRFGRPGEDGPDGDGPDQRAGAEAGVEDPVVRPTWKVDPEVVGGHHRHLADEGQRQQREHEHRHQAASDHPVLAGRGDAGGQLAPPAGVRRVPGARAGSDTTMSAATTKR